MVMVMEVLVLVDIDGAYAATEIAAWVHNI